jgi:hypothetical protein
MPVRSPVLRGYHPGCFEKAHDDAWQEQGAEGRPCEYCGKPLPVGCSRRKSTHYQEILKDNRPAYRTRNPMKMLRMDFVELALAGKIRKPKGKGKQIVLDF